MNTRNRIYIAHWLAGRPTLNYGEALIYLIAQRLGIEVVPLPAGTDPVDEAWLWIGSELHARPGGMGTLWHALRHARRVRVWGQGNGRGAEVSMAHLPPADRRRVDLLAVRGPLTAEQIGFDGPQGDPGFLLPLLVPKPAPSGEHLLAPHWDDREGFDLPPGASLLNVELPPSAEVARRAVERIAAAESVTTSSMHVYITARAYGVPVRVFQPRGGQPMPDKWCDVTRWLDAGGATEPLLYALVRAMPGVIGPTKPAGQTASRVG